MQTVDGSLLQLCWQILLRSLWTTFMRTVLALGKFRIYDEMQSLQNNATKRYGKTWISSNGADSKEKNSECEIHTGYITLNQSASGEVYM